MFKDVEIDLMMSFVVIISEKEVKEIDHYKNND